MTDLKELIINKVNDCIITLSPTGIIEYINDTSLKLLDIKKENTISESFFKTLPKLPLEQCIKENNFSRIQGKKISVNNKILSVSCLAKYDCNKLENLTIIMHDITNLRLIAQDLGKVTEDKVRIEKSLDILDDAIIIIDTWGKVTNVNKKASLILEEKGIKKFLNKKLSEIFDNNIVYNESLNNGTIDLYDETGNSEKYNYFTFPIYISTRIMGYTMLLKNIDNKSKFNFDYNYINFINNRSNTVTYKVDHIVGQSGKIISLKSIIKKIAKTKTTVLLQSESGTGKELFAQAIHNLSSRSKGPFIKVNCASLPDSLLESELFGYEEGAFTGAKKGGYKGRFELANGGTLFLDEIGEIPLSTQVKLLRVLQEREIQRLGDEDIKKIDVRIICATNKNLKSLTERKEFREDLYYRLNVAKLEIPPLRDRKEDIQSLTIHFLRKFSKEFQRKVNGVSSEVYNLFLNYSWPGNVRELGNVLEYAFNIIEGETIQLNHLPSYLTKKSGSNFNNKKLVQYLYECEKEAILNAIKQTDGNKVQASKILGISRAKLYRKLEKIENDINYKI